MWTRGSRLFNASLLDGQTQVVQNGEHLTLRPPGNAQTLHFAGYVSAAMDLTGASATVGVQPASGGALTNFALVVNPNTWYAFAATNDTLVFISRENGALSSTNIPFNRGAHRFWRFRHDRASNVLFWETRGPAGSWRVRHALTPQLSLSSAELELSAGTSAGVSDPGTAAFDTFGLQLPKQ